MSHLVGATEVALLLTIQMSLVLASPGPVPHSGLKLALSRRVWVLPGFVRTLTLIPPSWKILGFYEIREEGCRISSHLLLLLF